MQFLKIAIPKKNRKKSLQIREHLSSLIQLTNLKIREFLHRIDVDKAVLYGFLAKIWSLVAGPITAILIATKFTPELQGYYYTFASLLALQVFVELGLGTVIVQFASHEWSKLGFDSSGRIVGDAIALSRLVSIANIVFKWYFVGAIIISIGLGAGGFFFFSQEAETVIHWTAPWLMLSLLTGVTLCFVPVWSLLEGCNQVAKVYMYRFFDGVIKSIPLWLAISMGAELWTPVVSSVFSLILAVLFLYKYYWEFLKSLIFSRSVGDGVKWNSEILPMQWRVAVSWISGYCIYSIMTPVLFKYQGAAVAGQMGLTWSLLSVLGVASSFLHPKVPQFGIFVAQKKYRELDNYFWKITRIFVSIAVFIALSIYILVWILDGFNFPLASRLLPILPTSLFLLAQFFMTVSIPFSYYMFAHKENPLTLLTVVNAILTGTATLILGKYYSAIGIAWGFLLIQALIIPFIFFIWYRCRLKWHGRMVS